MSRARDLSKLANPQVFSVDTDFNVGVDSTTPDAKFDVVGVVSATQFYGDGSNLTGIIAGATLADSNGTQRVVLTSQTTGSMTSAGTTSNLTYDTGTRTLSATTFVGSLLGNATGLQGTPNITVQDVTAETVSVAGTISYEDVTNVNSVGIVTANQGITVPDYGVTVTGVVTATSFSGDGSQLNGIENGVANFVASGTIPNGSTVIIKDDGTVGIVTSTGSPDPSAGTEAVFASVNSENPAVIYDSTNSRVVIGYRDKADANQAGTAVVGAVNSDDTITFGTPVVFETGQSEWIGGTYDSDNGKVVFVYQDWADSTKGKAVVGTVSGSSISFGTPVVFETGETTYTQATYDSGNQKVIIVYRDQGNSSYGTAVVGTVSGTSISFSSPVVFNSGDTDYIGITYDSNSNRVVIVYRDSADLDKGKAVVGDASSGSITFGTPVEYGSGNTPYNSVTFDETNQKVVIAYRDGANSNYGTARVGTVSGSSISFGTAVVFEQATSNFINTVYDSVNQKVVISYTDSGNNNNLTGIVGTVSGTSITFGSPLVIHTGNPSYVDAAYVGSNQVVNAYNDSTNSNYGTSVVFASNSFVTNLTTENYIGIAAETIADGATGKVNIIGGVNSGQTGLTTAQTYYVKPDGTIDTSAGFPSVVAGTSVSSSKLLVWKS